MNNERPENKMAAKRAGDLPAPLPLENGKPRVQRLVDQLAPVHLELDPPTRETWTVSVEGMVELPVDLTLDALRELGAEPISSDFHCVWGWSRPKVNWVGVPAGKVLDITGVSPAATHVRFAAADSPYASCVPLSQARDGWFALSLEGEDLPAIHGGPVRWLQPSYLWGYKGVKWVCALHVLDHMDAGPWETKVGDVDGNVPQGLIDRFDLLEETS
jgi:DMSO/TMAO reductase YedYZ molybdopterin-dependent catalytic subunit